MKTIISTLLSFLILNSSITDDTNNKPSNPTEDGIEASLDFWIGDWNLKWKDGQGKTQRGHNRISQILDNKVILEEFDGQEAMNFQGMSTSVFDQSSKTWKQTWVDSRGSYMDFEGHKKDDTFIFARSFEVHGKMITTRMVFKKIKENSFIWDWEKSTDNGKTWILQWQIYYNRK